VKFTLEVALSFSLLIFGCVKHEVTRITMKVADNYSGSVHLSPCIEGAAEPVVLDGEGRGQTAACPAGDVLIGVIEPSKSFDIPSERVRVHQHGNDEPVAITFNIP
jgi:hypothetical protein